MKYDIDNQSRQSKAFQTLAAGLQIVKPGKVVTLDLRAAPSDADIAAHARAGVMIKAHAEPKVEPKPKPEPKRTELRDKATD